MAWRRKTGLYLFVALLLGAAGWAVASRLGLLDRATDRLFPVLQRKGALSPGDFPAGVTAPGGDIASVPLRPTLIGFTPRGGAGAVLLAHGGGGAAAPGGGRINSAAPPARGRGCSTEAAVRTEMQGQW